MKGAASVRVSLALAVSLCPLVLSGCSAITNIAPTNSINPVSSTSKATIHGVVHGGQNPISGAHVYFYALGGTGYGQPAVSLLTSGTQDSNNNYYVTTGSDGSFSITGDYTCPVANAYPSTYLLAIGGDSGSGNNSAISLVAPAGNCTSTNFTSEYVIVNEITTISAIYAAQGFITDLTHVSAPNTALAQTALGSIDTGNLYDSNSTARTTTQGGNGTVPQTEINTLANILAACVNSNGAVTGPTNPSPCYTLFNNAPSAGVNPTIPTDTGTAALNIARDPGGQNGVNIANLFSLQTAGAAFQPDLPAVPNDFTIAITYTATPALNSPAGLAIDGSGDIWVANNAGNSLTEFGSDGSYIQTVTTGGLKGPSQIAIDGSGNLWVSNFASGINTISEFSSSGVANSSSPFSGGGLTTPEGLAVDAQGHLWVANSGANILSEFNVSNGSPVSSTGITTASLDSPDFVAVDDNGDVWITNSGNSSVSLWQPGFGSLYTGFPYSDGGLNSPRGVAIDSNNNAWIANRGANVASEFANTGPDSSSGYTVGGLNGSLGIAVDSSDHVWIVNRVGNTVTELASNGSALSPSTGFYGAGSTTPILNTPGWVAIDLDGNVWVTNSGGNTLVEYVGAATPLVTPIVANLITGQGYGDSAVNKP
jgi:streptogramin lyase